MATARSLQTATLLSDGTVLIVGGLGSAGPVLNAEVYEPSIGAFSAAGPMVADSTGTSTLLADGRVLLAGGQQAQIYDPSTRTFAITGNATAILGCAATLLGNGKVLFTDDPAPYGPLGSGELYNPATGAFELTGPYASAGIAQRITPTFQAKEAGIAGGPLGWPMGASSSPAESPLRFTTRKPTRSASSAQ